MRFVCSVCKCRFVLAAKDGNLDAVRQALSATDVDVNMRGMWNNTPLICACQYRHADIAITLCDAGADVNAVNEKGNTALLHAAVEGLTDVVVALLAKGASPAPPASIIYNGEADANQVLTPFIAACMNNRVDVASVLLRAGADAHAPVTGGRCHMAALSAIFSPSQPHARLTPLQLVTAAGHDQLVQILTMHISESAGGSSRNSPSPSGVRPPEPTVAAKDTDVVAALFASQQ